MSKTSVTEFRPMPKLREIQNRCLPVRRDDYPQTPETIARAKQDQEQQRIRSLAHILALFSDAIPPDRPRTLTEMPGWVAYQLTQLAADVLEEVWDLDGDIRAAYEAEARRG